MVYRLKLFQYTVSGDDPSTETNEDHAHSNGGYQLPDLVGSMD